VISGVPKITQFADGDVYQFPVHVCWESGEQLLVLSPAAIEAKPQSAA